MVSGEAPAARAAASASVRAADQMAASAMRPDIGARGVLSRNMPMAVKSRLSGIGLSIALDTLLLPFRYIHRLLDEARTPIT